MLTLVVSTATINCKNLPHFWTKILHISATETHKINCYYQISEKEKFQNGHCCTKFLDVPLADGLTSETG